MAGRLLGPSYYDEIAIARSLLPKSAGVMVDVGAHEGGALWPFAQAGWDVYAFEPDPKNRAVLLQRVEGDTRVEVDERAISEVDGDTVELFTSEVSSGISSMAAFHPSHQASASVQTVRLDTFLSQHDVPSVDFLKVDTEGFDLHVLRTFPWDRHRPTVVVCEFEDRKTKPLGYDYADLAQFLMARGYVVLVSEWKPIVEYGMSHTWLRVRRFPAELDHEDSWGNFVAVPPELADDALKVARRQGRRLRLRRTCERMTRT